MACDVDVVDILHRGAADSPVNVCGNKSNSNEQVAGLGKRAGRRGGPDLGH